MVRKILLATLLLASISAFAATTSSAPVKLNPPTVGSRQSGSEQIFGSQKITGKKGEVYDHSGAKIQNNPTVGSRQSGSEQIFGDPKVTGKAGQKYNSSSTKRLNKATVGSRQSGSEQLFGNPGSSEGY